MARPPAMGFEVWAPPNDLSAVVVGDLFQAVPDLAHAPTPLNGLREIVSSSGYRMAARRYQRELENRGATSDLIIRRMNEPTAFRRIAITGEYAVLPPGAALKAGSPEQQLICRAAWHTARRREVEGFRLRSASHSQPRLLVLEDAADEAIHEIEAHHFAPAHFLTPEPSELFERGR